MKKIMFTSLILTIPFLCRSADDEVDSWYRAVEGIVNLDQQEELDLSNKQIKALPDNLDTSRLVELYLHNNLLRVLPSQLDFSSPQILFLSYNRLINLPDVSFPELIGLDLTHNEIMFGDVNTLLEHFPKLKWLNLGQNPIIAEDIEVLKEAYPTIAITT